MKSLQSSLSTRLQSLKESPKSKATSSWTALCEDIHNRWCINQGCRKLDATKEEKKKCTLPMKRFIWLFWKVDEYKIRKAFQEADTVENLIKFSLNQK